MNSLIATQYNTTTLLGSQLGLSTLLPVEFESNYEFTLNNNLQIQPNVAPSQTPRLRYFGIGINGCYNATDTNLVSAYNPQRTDMNLYQLVPIRCRPVDEDLSEAERANYRLRKRVTLNGNQYYLYYLKLLSFSEGVKFKRIDPATGREEAYELNSSNLNPTPVKPSTDTVLTTDIAKIVAYCVANVNVTADEMLEYINVAYNGDARYARVSEIGFFTGDDKLVQGTTGQGVSISYTEAVYTMLYNHLTLTGAPLTNSGMSLNAPFEITSSGIYEA